MMDYRSMFDRDYIGAWDIPAGKDVVVTICKVEARKLRNKTAANTKPVLFFVGKEKGFACNKTNGKAIAGMYGNDADKWIGKRISLYATTTTFGSETVECIRVRPMIPQSSKQDTPDQAKVPDAKSDEQG